VPLGWSATSRVGYNGYWVSQLNAKGEGKPYGGKLVIHTTDSGAGLIRYQTSLVQQCLRNGIPTNSVKNLKVRKGLSNLSSIALIATFTVAVPTVGKGDRCMHNYQCSIRYKICIS
jgi:hypothetical protein